MHFKEIQPKSEIEAGKNTLGNTYQKAMENNFCKEFFHNFSKDFVRQNKDTSISSISAICNKGKKNYKNSSSKKIFKG